MFSAVLESVKAIARGLVLVYRMAFSPVLHWIGGPGFGCRFYPTCSQYADEAIRTHGAVRGAVLTLKRIVRCRPFGPSGYDPVPRGVAEK